MERAFHAAARLLDHCRAHCPADRRELRESHWHRTDDARVRTGLVAEQAAVPDTGRITQCGARIPAPGHPLDVIVVDFFHWPKQGEYCFDPDYWPDPARMIAELEAMGTKLMVSIWPTIDKTSTHFEEMFSRGLLVRSNRGISTTMDFLGDTVFFDATHPQARDYIWRLVKENYYDKGVRIFWLDEAEPEYSVYDFDNYRYYAGTDLQVGNIYPRNYAQG